MRTLTVIAGLLTTALVLVTFATARAPNGKRIVAAAAIATGSSARLPDENGRIAFGRYFGPRYEDQTRGVIFTVARSGRGERHVTHPRPEASDFEPDWSPDGSRIAFTRSDRSGPAIYTVRPDGPRLTRVSRGCRRATPWRCDQDVAPAFSPNGRDIAFASSDGRLKRSRAVSGAASLQRLVPPAGIEPAHAV